MKRSNYLIYLSALLSIIQMSCEKEDKRVASFLMSTTSAEVYDTITFTNTSENATSYFWDFGDENTSTVENPSYSYNIPGNFTIELTAKNGSDSASYSLEIDIEAPLIVPGVKIGELIVGDFSNSNFDTFYANHPSPDSDIVNASNGWYKTRIVDYTSEIRFYFDGYQEGQIIKTFRNFIETSELSGWIDVTLREIVIYSSSFGMTEDNLTIGSKTSEVKEKLGTPDSEGESFLRYDEGIIFGLSNAGNLYRC